MIKVGCNLGGMPMFLSPVGLGNSQDIAIPMMAMSNALTRMTFAGDSHQLLLLIFTELAQKI